MGSMKDKWSDLWREFNTTYDHTDKEQVKKVILKMLVQKEIDEKEKDNKYEYNTKKK